MFGASFPFKIQEKSLHKSGPDKGDYERGLSLEQSLGSLKSLNSLESLENGRLLLHFPVWGFSKFSRESPNSLHSLKDPFSFFRTPIKNFVRGGLTPRPSVKCQFGQVSALALLGLLSFILLRASLGTWVAICPLCRVGFGPERREKRLQIPRKSSLSCASNNTKVWETGFVPVDRLHYTRNWEAPICSQNVCSRFWYPLTPQPAKWRISSWIWTWTTSNSIANTQPKFHANRVMNKRGFWAIQRIRKCKCIVILRS